MSLWNLMLESIINMFFKTRAKGITLFELIFSSSLSSTFCVVLCFISLSESQPIHQTRKFIIKDNVPFSNPVLLCHCSWEIPLELWRYFLCSLSCFLTCKVSARAFDICCVLRSSFTDTSKSLTSQAPWRTSKISKPFPTS